MRMSRIHPVSASENKWRAYGRLCHGVDVVHQYRHVDHEHESDSSRTRINPVSVHVPVPVPVPVLGEGQNSKTLTVWKRSSMSFHGSDGFTVYDSHGNLVFRVDNYSRSHGNLVLMDGSGKPLLSLKPQFLSMQHQWNGCKYSEEENGTSRSKRIFIMRRPSSSDTLVLGGSHNQQKQIEAEVFFTNKHHQSTDAEASGTIKQARKPDYWIEGSYWQRNCKIRCNGSDQVAAMIIRKRNASAGAHTSTIMLSEEVFSLVVERGYDPQLIMAFVVVLDRICFKPFYPHFIC